MSGLNELNFLDRNRELKEYEPPIIGKLYRVNPELQREQLALAADHPVKWVYLEKSEIYMLISFEPIFRENNAGPFWSWKTTFLVGETLITGNIPCWVWHHWMNRAMP